MELLQLRYFCDTAKFESISAVALSYGVPRSSVSQSIKRLEKELNGTLFVRKANRVVLTDAGKTLYERLAPTIEEIDAACKDLSESNGASTIRICINCNRRVVMAAIESFQKLHPNVRIVAKHGAAPDSDTFDLIVSNELIGARSDNRLLLSEEIALAYASGSSLSDAKEITPQLLSGQSFITMSEPNSLFRITKTICKTLGFSPKIAIQSDDPFYVRKCVELGLGVAFVPLFSWKGQFAQSVSFARVGNYSRDTYLYVPKQRATKQILAFIDTLLLECKKN